MDRNRHRAPVRHTFMVHVWQEPSEVAPNRWRGSVEHVPSAQRLYFTSLGDLTDFITLALVDRFAVGKSSKTGGLG